MLSAFTFSDDYHMHPNLAAREPRAKLVFEMAFAATAFEQSGSEI